MSDDNTKETNLDRFATAGWAFAGWAVGTLATIIAAMNVYCWWFP